MSGHIYFCLCSRSGAVKIGHSTRVERRVRAIDAVSPFGVSLLATVPATLLDEKDLHRALDAFRTRSGRRTEWYFWKREISELVDICLSGASAGELISAAYAISGTERNLFPKEYSCEGCGSKFLRNRADVRNGQTRFCTKLCAAHTNAEKRLQRRAGCLINEIEEATA